MYQILYASNSISNNADVLLKITTTNSFLMHLHKTVSVSKHKIHSL